MFQILGRRQPGAVHHLDFWPRFVLVRAREVNYELKHSKAALVTMSETVVFFVLTAKLVPALYCRTHGEPNGKKRAN